MIGIRHRRAGLWVCAGACCISAAGCAQSPPDRSAEIAALTERVAQLEKQLDAVRSRPGYPQISHDKTDGDKLLLKDAQGRDRVMISGSGIDLFSPAKDGPWLRIECNESDASFALMSMKSSATIAIDGRKATVTVKSADAQSRLAAIEEAGSVITSFGGEASNLMIATSRKEYVGIQAEFSAMDSFGLSAAAGRTELTLGEKPGEQVQLTAAHRVGSGILLPGDTTLMSSPNGSVLTLEGKPKQFENRGVAAEKPGTEKQD